MMQAASASACRPRSSSPMGRQTSESSYATADWTRMRTPSPERSYVKGYPLPAPQIILAPVFVPYGYMPTPVVNQQPPPMYPCNVATSTPATDAAEIEVMDTLPEETPLENTLEGSMLDTLPEDFIHSNLKIAMDDKESEADTTDVGSEYSSLGSEHSSIDDMDLPDDIPSIGSLNHPHSCGQPCKYIKKARGCKDGINCFHCHICTWQSRRHGKSKKMNPKSIPSVGELSLAPPCC